MSAFLELPGDALQGLLTVGADYWAMVHHLIRTRHRHQGASRMSRLPSGRLLAPLALPPGLAPWAITRRGLAAIVAVFGQLAFHPLQAFGQLADLLVGLG